MSLSCWFFVTASQSGMFSWVSSILVSQLKDDSEASKTRLERISATTDQLAEQPTVLVIGGTGYFGRLLVHELVRFTACNIVIGARNQEKINNLIEASECKSRLAGQVVDMNEPATISAALDNASVAVCAAGPFQFLPVDLARLCIERSIHYVDLSDARNYVRDVRKLGSEGATSSVICTGWSTMPALSGLLARIAGAELESIAEIFIQIAPGNKSPRGQATVNSLLESLGRKFSVWRNGEWADLTGWSCPREFDFPPPVGRRRGYLVDVVDYDFFPSIFDAKTVEFRVGAEFELLNRAVSIAAWCIERGAIASLRPFSKVLRLAMASTGWIGNDWGAVGVECRNSSTWARASIVAEHNGHWMPVMPASIVIERLASGNPLHGMQDPTTWLSRDQLESECIRRGYRLVLDRGENGS